MLHFFSLSDRWFDLVAAGTKRYEGRRWWPKTQGVKVGDRILFTHVWEPERTTEKEVVAVHRFPTFEAALMSLPLADVLPGVRTVGEGCGVYEQYVSRTTQERDGVVLFELSDVGTGTPGAPPRQR